MEERYEIRGKIGQGGVGAVYRAFDKILSREVAIKRILPDENVEPNSEAASQLAKEAGALSALQHPHIVTIYDVGTDKDGAFVVMELLQGKTVDEVVEKAVFTWPDFREFAMQTQEALIAAQDLNLVHRDLKPSNIMLTWLPSGKFQVKIVDFGLAKFTPKPSLQTIDQKDSIFGSIFFMAPEQFERVELDARTDMYAIGCVYYYALTGVHPFDGETGPQVMVAHLDHRVFPLHEIRPDLPRWVSDWIMWHINRLPEHRPAHARDSLALFMQNDQLGDQAVVVETPPPPRAKPKLLTPGAPAAATAPPERPAPPLTSLLKTAPQPIKPPDNFGHPSIHTSAQVTIQSNDDFAPAPNAPAPADVAAPPVSEPPPPPAPAAEPTATAVEASMPKAKPRLIIPGGNTTSTPAAVSATPAAVPAAAPATPSAIPAAPAAVPAPPIVVPAVAVATPAAVPPPPVIQAAIPAAVPVAAPAAIPVAAPVAAIPVVATPVTPPVAVAVAVPAVATPAAIPTAKPAMQNGPTPIAPARAVATGPVVAPKAQPVPTKGPATAAAAPQQVPAGAQLTTSSAEKKKSMSNGAKAAIATTLGLIIIVAGSLMISRNAQGKDNKRYNELVALAAMPTTKEIMVSSKDLDILLDAATSIAASTSRETVYKALYISESNDGTNVDEKLVNFTTSVNMNETVRANLLRRVIGGRIVAGHKDDKTATALINFVKTNPKPDSASAALEALKPMAKDDHFVDILGLLQFAADSGVRKRCEEVVVAIIDQSSNRGALDELAQPAFQSATVPEVKQALLRVIGATGTPKAKELIISQLKGSDKAMQIAAADGSKNWPDDSLLQTLLETLDEIDDKVLRPRVFQSCRESLLSESKRGPAKNEELWTLLANAAKEEAEQLAVIRDIVGKSEINSTDWARQIIKNYEEKSESDSVVDLANRALDRLNSKAQKKDDKSDKDE